MAEPQPFTTSVNVTITVSFTDSIVGTMYADAPEAERRAMLLEAIDEQLQSMNPPVPGRERFVVYSVDRD